MRAYIHTYIHACMHTYIHTHISTCIMTYTHACIHIYIHAYMHTYMHIQTWSTRFKSCTHIRTSHAYFSIHAGSCTCAPALSDHIHAFIHTYTYTYKRAHTRRANTLLNVIIAVTCVVTERISNSYDTLCMTRFRQLFAAEFLAGKDDVLEQAYDAYIRGSSSPQAEKLRAKFQSRPRYV
jgi:hypothetical protein